MIDVLSPRFAEVLEPGPDYVGGREFFFAWSSLVRTIPNGDIITVGTVMTEPPGSLLEAMRIFFLGVAAGILEDDGTNRSMMVHPSQQTNLHIDYSRWIREATENWRRTLELKEGDSDRDDVVADFRRDYDDLRATVEALPSFDELLAVLPRAIRKTRLWEVNARAGQTPQPNWQANYSHILVGGQALDRGFTVSGLTVTYMPRGTGTGQADTIQQRARFFGYKRGYLGYCRIYLENAARDAYQRYVGHEEDIRERLIAHRRTGRPLSEWKRAFFLDAALQPTRQSVMSLDYMQSAFANQWCTPSAPHDSREAVTSNRDVVRAFAERLDLQQDTGSEQRTEMQKHFVAEAIPLRLVFEELLTRLRITRATDSQRFTGLLLQIREHLDGNPEARATVYVMSRGRERVRGTNDEDEVPQLFQGADPVEQPGRGSIYPGDREIRVNGVLTVQIHQLRVKRKSGEELADVPTVAVYVPQTMERTWVVQETP